MNQVVEVKSKNTRPLSPADGKRHWVDAFVAIDHLRRDNEDTEQVFRIIRALQGNSSTEQFDKFVANDFGKKVIDERRDLVDLLSKRDWLRTLPEGSLGRVYLDFMEKEGLSAEGLREASEDGGFVADESEQLDERHQVFSDWNRDMHDLFHVVTGYGRDPLAELCLLGVTYHQTKSLGVGFIASLGSFELQRELPGTPALKAVYEGFKIGKKCEWLVVQDWEKLLPMQIEDVREQLGLRPPKTYYKVLDLVQAKQIQHPRYPLQEQPALVAA